MQGSDLTSFHGGTRELFVNYKEFVLYAGSYKCHDLRALQPEGIALPGQIVGTFRIQLNLASLTVLSVPI
jgi:hypothetical protein